MKASSMILSNNKATAQADAQMYAAIVMNRSACTMNLLKISSACMSSRNYHLIGYKCLRRSNLCKLYLHLIFQRYDSNSDEKSMAD